MSIIHIRKLAGQRKDAFRLNSQADIPEFLLDNIHIDAQGTAHLYCVEGQLTCSLGTVIGYETSPTTDTGYNVWPIGNAATNLIEENGVFYQKPTVLKAELIGEQPSELVAGCVVWRNYDENSGQPWGSWTIVTDWGESTGMPGQAYWVRYGTKPDGKPDANILTRGEQSFLDYYVCTADGTLICPLAEYQPA